MIDCAVTAYIRGSNPVWYFVDLVGKQFDDTFYLWVLTDTIPYIPATVYHDASGTIPWTSPIQFLANGTLPIDIYYANNTLYRLEIRQNDGTAPPSQADALIYLIEDYNPGNVVSGNPSTVQGDATTNQITNPQFAVVNFSQPVTYSNLTTSIEVAPGWFLDLTGTGSVTVSQSAFSNTVSNPTNAPYALQLNITGPYANPPVLRQRFDQNGMNWAGKVVSTSFTAQVGGTPVIIMARLYASNGAPLAILKTATLSNTFQEFQGFSALPASTNPNTPPAAWLDYELVLPSAGDIYITSVQVIVSDAMEDVPYQQDTIDRQLDHLAHYYDPQLAYKPIPSYLAGWDFAKNPAQLLGDVVPSGAGYGANKSFYVWDQTIAFQSVNNGVGVTRSTNGGGIQLVASLTGQFAILQYLEAAQVRDLLQGDMSVFISGLTNNANGYIGNISLWVNNTDANLPNVATGTNLSAITALSASGKPTMGNGTWSEIPRSNFGDVQFEFAPALSELSFNGWNLNGAAISNNAIWFAIVIGFAPVTATDSITIQSVGLCAGKMATRPAPKGRDEALRDCERYYEKSYQASTAPGTVTLVNALTAPQQSTLRNAANNFIFRSQSFSWEYRTLKRIPSGAGIPTITLYSTATANTPNVLTASMVFNGAVLAGPTDVAIANWAASSIGNKFAGYTAAGAPGSPTFNNAGAGSQAYELPSAYVQFHYVVDARLGIVN